jgi:hypothetical protein
LVFKRIPLVFGIQTDPFGHQTESKIRSGSQRIRLSVPSSSLTSLAPPGGKEKGRERKESEKSCAFSEFDLFNAKLLTKQDQREMQEKRVVWSTTAETTIKYKLLHHS